jgi:hypothetical protein
MSEYVAHTETDKATGITLQIIADQDGGSAWDPQEDEAVIFASIERNSINPAEGAQCRDNVPGIVDEDGDSRSCDFDSVADLKLFAAQNCGEGKDWEAFPLFKYEHGRVAYSCDSFSCQWDSGQSGFIFIHKPSVGDSPREAADGFCKTYTSWANGDVWGYVVEDADGEHLDSCWGFIGDSDESYMMSEARDSFRHEVEKAQAAITEAERAAELAEAEAARFEAAQAADVDTVRAYLANPSNNIGQEVLDAFDRLHPES